MTGKGKVPPVGSVSYLSYLTTISCPFGRYRYLRLPLEQPWQDMFQKKWKKTLELFSGMSNIFGIGDGILITGFGEWGKAMMNLKLKKKNVSLGMLAFPSLIK